jgi:hypothetical protein
MIFWEIKDENAIINGMNDRCCFTDSVSPYVQDLSTFHKNKKKCNAKMELKSCNSKQDI